MKVIVVGAGIIGSCVAFQLSRQGAEVIVVDGGTPAATSTSFGWINASFYADVAHHHLRLAGMAAYGRMITDLPDAPISMAGALWWEDQGAGLAKMRDDLTTLGYPVEQLERSAALELEPDLRGLPADLLRFPSEGAAEAGDLADHLLKQAQKTGARLVSGVRVHGLEVADGVIGGVATDIGVISADRVVVAAGNGAPEILRSVGVRLPMLTRPGVLVTTKPIKAKISSILVTPFGEVRQLPDGRILASAAANHQSDDASEVTETAEEIADRLIGWLTPLVADEALDWDQVALAYRPVPEDGLPVIGQAGPVGLHIAVMHSGVTLAAIAGEAVAAEVLGLPDAHADLLGPYRPTRFQ